MNDQLAGFFALLRRYPHAAACFLTTLLCAGGAWYLWGQVKAQEVTRQDRAKEGEAMLSLLVGGSTQRQELEHLADATRRMDENLVVESNLAENTWYFFKFEEQTKVRLGELHQLNSPITDTSPLFRRVPYTLRVSGTFNQVHAFIFAIETGPRLAKVTSFSLTRGSTIVADLTLEVLGKK